MFWYWCRCIVLMGVGGGGWDWDWEAGVDLQPTGPVRQEDARRLVRHQVLQLGLSSEQLPVCERQVALRAAELVARFGHLGAMLDARVLWTRAQELVSLLSPVERRHRHIEAAHMRTRLFTFDAPACFFQFSFHSRIEYSTTFSVVYITLLYCTLFYVADFLGESGWIRMLLPRLPDY